MKTSTLFFLLTAFLAMPCMAERNHSVSSHRAELLMFGNDHVEIELLSTHSKKVKFTITDAKRKPQSIDKFLFKVYLANSPSATRTRARVALDVVASEGKGKVTVELPKTVDLDSDNQELQICLKRKTHSEGGDCNSGDFQSFDVFSLNHHYED